MWVVIQEWNSWCNGASWAWIWSRAGRLPCWHADCRLQFGLAWFSLSTCPWVTCCKKGDGSADTSKKAAFLKCEFACFAWNCCIRTLIHPLSTEYSCNSLFCRMKPRSVKMHPFEALDVTGLGDIFLLSFQRKVFWSHENVIGNWRSMTRGYLNLPGFYRFLHKWIFLVIR